MLRVLRAGSRGWGRVWGGKVYYAVELLVGDEELDGSDEIGFVNPGDELIAGEIRQRKILVDVVCRNGVHRDLVIGVRVAQRDLGAVGASKVSRGRRVEQLSGVKRRVTGPRIRAR